MEVLSPDRLLTLDGPEVAMRTGAWYAEEPLVRRFPAGWEVAAFSPATPPLLTQAELAGALEHPLGQPPLRVLARGKSRPLVIVDDLSRPTPAAPVLPAVLRQLADAGIPASRITILLAAGMHFQTPADALARKVGPEIASGCRLVTHDPRGPMADLGRTACGTKILVNPEVAAADLVIGLGGAYPSSNLGFGGGSKLLIGVLGASTIYRLHSYHPDVGWGVLDEQSSFRRDLDEIAARSGLAVSICVHVDPNRAVVRLSSGDSGMVFRDGAAFTQQAYGVSAPGDADLVVCNAYPSDVTLFYALAKATAPFGSGRRGASRLLVAACSEGEGFHGLFWPGGRRRTRGSRLAMHLSAYSAGELVAGTVRLLARKIKGARSSSLRQKRPRGQAPPSPPLRLYRPGEHAQSLPPGLPVTVQASWPEALARVWEEQGKRPHLKVAVYPEASLVWMRRE